MAKPKKQYPAFQEAQILWECDFPSKPDLLESLIRERIGLKQSIDLLEAREKEINTSLLAFFHNNRIPGVQYEGYTVSVKEGTQVTINREALLLAGAKKEVIDACMKRTPWETVECRKGKEEGDGQQPT